MNASERERNLLRNGAAVLALAVAMRFGVFPIVAGVHTARADLERARDLLDRDEAQLRKMKDLPRAVERATGRVLAGAPRLLPAASQTQAQAWLVWRVGETARTAPVQITRTEVLSPAPASDLTEVALRVEGEGEFGGLMALLAGVEGDPVFLRVSTLEVGRQSPSELPGREPLTFRFTVGGFLLVDGDSTGGTGAQSR